jgi:DNA replication protein DnaC
VEQVDIYLRDKIAAFKAKAEAIASGPPLPPSNPPDGTPGCDLCNGTGWRQPQPDARYVRCGCVVPVIVSAQGVPYEFREATLDNYREEDGNKVAVAKAKSFSLAGRDLYLVGGVGAGKTRLACSILNEFANRMKTCLFARVPMLLHQLQPGRDAGDLEARLFSVPLVALDDLGAERDQATDYTRRTLLLIYEERHDRGLPTIFTSNKTISQIAEMQDDDRLASRIAGRADVVKLSTPDQRMLRRVK